MGGNRRHLCLTNKTNKRSKNFAFLSVSQRMVDLETLRLPSIHQMVFADF